MIKASYHSHSGQFCHHAKGSLEEVVKSAIAKGFKVYGLSEHMPRYDRKHLYPEEHGIEPHDLVRMFHAYVLEARRLREVYKNDIEILIGLETEFIDPGFINEIINLRAIYGLDYIVGSVHHVNGIPIDFNEEMFDQALTACDGNLDMLFITYFDNQYSLLQSIKPEIVGHFDLIRLFRPSAPLSPEVLQVIKRNIDFIVSYGGIFEINTRGWKKIDTCYPFPDVVDLIKKAGGRFTLADDSHGPDDVGMHYEKAFEFLQSDDITEIFLLRRKEVVETDPVSSLQTVSFKLQ